MNKLIIYLFFFIFFSCSSPINNKGFELYGTLNESKADFVVLSYENEQAIYIIDSIEIINGKFFTSGKINGPTLASITGNILSNRVSDPNFTEIFLEPKKISISLAQDKFKHATVEGSITNDEHIKIEKVVEPIYDEINKISIERDVLFDLKEKGNHSDSVETSIKDLTNEWSFKLNKIKNVRLDYVINNPNSYLSAYLVYFYRKQIPTDSLKSFLKGFGPNVKEGLYANKIKKEIEVTIIRPGDLAPSFKDIDLHGNIIDLNQFKGKYVLLDFWAGWCIPCIEIHPELKRLYKTYHPKGLEVIGISLDKDKKTWQDMIKKEEIDWHHIFVGLDNLKDKKSIYSIYQIQPIPAYVLIDKYGYIIEFYLNADYKNKGGNKNRDLNELEKKLEELLNQK